MKNSATLVALAGVLSFGGRAEAVPVAVGNHSFESPALAPEATGAPAVWSLTGGGGGGILNGFAASGLVPRPDATSQNAWSNGAEFFQALGTAVAPNMTYTLTIDVGDRNDTAFPVNTEIRVGSGAAFGVNYLPFSSEVRPLPPDGGWSTWTAKFESGPSPVAGPLRVELINPGGAQPQFDNVRLDEAATPPPAPGPRDIFVRNHTFEDNGSPPTFEGGTPVLWGLGAGGGGGWMGGAAPELIPRPDGTDTHAWSNGQDIYQVTAELITAETLYTLTVDLGDRSGTAFSAGTELRLGAGSTFGASLLAPDSVVDPTPSSGWETWTTSRFIAAGDPLIGQPLRIELISGGVQPQFDDVRLTALTAVIPEPSTFLLGGLGLLGLTGTLRRRRDR